MGNGGSASTASHFACDLNKGVSLNLANRFRVIPLTDNLPTIMAYANDLSYEEIFIEQLKNFLAPGDLVIGISGSGNSVNVTRAVEYAVSQGNTTIGITGYDGGRLKKIADYSFNAGINDMQISEDLHMITAHILMRLLCEKLSTPENTL
jgi:D-sedoheptulose 7-phosphate isomerase